MPVAVDVARDDAARPAVGELDDRAEAALAQAEADEHAVGDDVELAVLVEVLEHQVDGRRGRERRCPSGGEKTSPSFSSTATLIGPPPLDPPFATTRSSEALSSTRPAAIAIGIVAAARERLERLELAALVLDQDGHRVVRAIGGRNVPPTVAVEVGDHDASRVVADTDGRAAR